MGSRKSVKINSDIPGPGAYVPKDISKPSTKSFKIMNPSKSTVDTTSKNLIPGPGQYTPERYALSNNKNLPKWTMGNKTASSSLYGRLEKTHGSTPAPGNYDLNRSLGEGPKVLLFYLLPNIFI
jgi:Sperm-tail PG-rich repeat